MRSRAVMGGHPGPGTGASFTERGHPFVPARSGAHTRKLSLFGESEFLRGTGLS